MEWQLIPRCFSKIFNTCGLLRITLQQLATLSNPLADWVCLPFLIHPGLITLHTGEPFCEFSHLWPFSQAVQPFNVWLRCPLASLNYITLLELPQKELSILELSANIQHWAHIISPVTTQCIKSSAHVLLSPEKITFRDIKMDWL